MVILPFRRSSFISFGQPYHCASCVVYIIPHSTLIRRPYYVGKIKNKLIELVQKGYTKHELTKLCLYLRWKIIRICQLFLTKNKRSKRIRQISKLSSENCNEMRLHTTPPYFHQQCLCELAENEINEEYLFMFINWLIDFDFYNLTKTARNSYKPNLSKIISVYLLLLFTNNKIIMYNLFKLIKKYIVLMYRIFLNNIVVRF